MTPCSRAILLAAVLAAPALAAGPDLKRLTDHMHKAFSTPLSMKLEVQDLVPAEIPGFLAGSLVVTEEGKSQSQPILVSQDGRWYVVGALYRVAASGVPGFREILPSEGLPPPPPLLLSPDGKHAVAGKAQDASIDPDQDARSKISLKGVPFTGPADAPVTIVEYSELQCPHCKLAAEVLEKELPAYAGKVRFVFKHYPLKDMHPWSYDAAIAAACAETLNEGKAPAFRSAFFRAQAEVNAENVREKAGALAESVGLDKNALLRCYDTKGSRARVDGDLAEGDRVGVMGVPAIFINGRRTRGYQWPFVKPVIDEMLGSAAKGK